MKKYYTLLILLSIGVLAFSWKPSLTVSAAKPSDYGLKDGDLISAIFSDDPDVYIINDQGYKRLFLNPEIFKFYGHLGGFFNVKLVTSEVNNSFPISGLFRDCESNDQKVYGVDIDGEDTGQLHWVNSTGEQAVKDDPDFFKKVFCINNKEFNWYPKGTNLNTVKDVPDYARIVTNTQAPIEQVTASSSFKEFGRVVICHYLPGNPAKSETLTVDVSALKAHLAHDDTVGQCVGLSSTPAPTVTAIPIPTLSITPIPSQISSVSYSPIPTPVSTPSTSSGPTPMASATSTPTPIPTSDILGPWITNLSISPTMGGAGQIITFSVTAEDSAGIGNIVLDIRYPGISYYLRPNWNFGGAQSGTQIFSQAIDNAMSPTRYGDYVIESIRAVDKLNNVSTYYPNYSVLNSLQTKHSLLIPAITITSLTPTPTPTPVTQIDFAVTSVTVSPSSVTQGNSVTVSATFYNPSNTTQSIQVTIGKGVSSTTDGTAMSTTYYLSLPPGNTTQTKTFTASYGVYSSAPGSPANTYYPEASISGVR